jgi:hypothetical protein
MNTTDRLFAPVGGYLVDLAALARGVPTNLHSYLKYLTLRSLGRRTGASCLIETGTFRGITAARCARSFERVVTIELDEALAREAAAYLARYPNVEVLQGDATRLLPQLMQRQDLGEAVVFLDAHYSGGVTAKGELIEPAIVELEILSGSSTRICGVVIDDFRLFGEEAGFPTKAALLEAAERLFPFPQFTIRAHVDQLVIERP